MAAMERLIILGSGGTSVDIADLAIQTGKFTPIGYLDDSRTVGEDVNGLPVLGGLADAVNVARDMQGPTPLFINGIGSSGSYRAKPRMVESTSLPPEAFATVIHPTSEDVMSPSAWVSEGVAIFPYTTLRNNTFVGAHSLILSHGSWGHGAFIGRYGTVATGVRAAGGVRAGECVYLGTNSVIIEDRRIGDGALVGAGAVVIRDVEPNTRVVGNPARVLPERQP